VFFSCLSIALNTIRLMIAGKQAYLTAIIKGINSKVVKDRRRIIHYGKV
jgi:hypothetical protein